MAITQGMIDNFEKKISKKPVKRNVAPPASNVTEQMFEFMLDIEPESLPASGTDDLIQLIDDLDYLDTHKVNEGLYFAKKSSSAARTVARKYYHKNRDRVKKLQYRL